MTRKMIRLGARAALLVCGIAGLVSAVGCSSSSQPSWASALGPSVTIVGPATVTSGQGSPGAAVQGVFAAVAAKQYKAECPYFQPSVQAACKSVPAAELSKDEPYFKNAAIGYVAIDGDKALVGTTGTFCVPNVKPACFTNNDPAAIFSGNKNSFGTLWTEQNKASNSNSDQNVYTLAPCVKIGGKWYLSAS
jgi:hypothetical protein